MNEVHDLKRFFSFCWPAVQAFAAGHGFSDEVVPAVDSDVGEEDFELVANARKIRKDGPRLYVVAHVHHIEAQGVGVRFHWDFVDTAEVQVRFQS